MGTCLFRSNKQLLAIALCAEMFTFTFDLIMTFALFKVCLPRSVQQTVSFRQDKPEDIILSTLCDGFSDIDTIYTC